jgi:hypothetical protein
MRLSKDARFLIWLWWPFYPCLAWMIGYGVAVAFGADAEPWPIGGLLTFMLAFLLLVATRPRSK